MKIDQLQTPCYVIDEKKMRENLEILKKVQEDTGCKILLAQKAFSGFALYPMIGKYLAGTTASGLFEARLGYEEMGKENHVFSPAYLPVSAPATVPTASANSASFICGIFPSLSTIPARDAVPTSVPMVSNKLM